MKERPILFSGPMVRAILEGRKTQTRRSVKPQPPKGYCYGYAATDHSDNVESFGFGPPKFPDKRKLDAGKKDCRRVHWFTSPYGQPGDRLWVKETFCPTPDFGFAYRATTDSEGDRCRRELGFKWKPSIFCTRAASRITLEVTAVRVERLRDISPEDALAEGIEHYVPGVTAGQRGEVEADPIEEYRELWESINGAGSWAENPWVWVIQFKVISK